MKRKVIETVAWAGLLLLCCIVWARASITVDGDLSDWGVTPFSDWVPDLVPTAAYATGNNDTSVAAGGERYDIEALYLNVSPTGIDFALVTSYNTGSDPGAYGAKPDAYSPYPTIALNVGEAAGIWNYAIQIDPVTDPNNPAVRLWYVAPDAYHQDAWLDGYYYPSLADAVSLNHDRESRLTDITDAFASAVAMLTDCDSDPSTPNIEPASSSGGWAGTESPWYAQEHTWIYEGHVEIASASDYLVPGTEYVAHNSMWCGNDVLTTERGLVTPEPGSIALSLTGLAGVGLAWWRRRKRRT
ncbi:MAG: PEP-CTERM sorting domain-containing protein [Armatimonadota bacterium]